MPGLEELPALRVPAVTAKQMAEIDRAAAEEYAIALDLLMENASRGIAVGARALLGGSVSGRRVVALAGPGNNGGDALGAARHLHNWGADVRCVLAQPADRLRELPHRQYQALAALPIPLEHGLAPNAFAGADVVLDGLLGYSASGAPRGGIAAMIDAANGSRVPILAIDLPSGLDPDTGAPLGTAIVAVVTVTLGLPKVGLVAERASRHVGTLLVADIAVPPEAYVRFGIDARGVFRDGDVVRVVGER
jgi:NAD(P)H-hydrate epimerase